MKLRAAALLLLFSWLMGFAPQLLPHVHSPLLEETSEKTQLQEADNSAECTLCKFQVPTRPALLATAIALVTQEEISATPPAAPLQNQFSLDASTAAQLRAPPVG